MDRVVSMIYRRGASGWSPAKEWMIRQISEGRAGI